VEAQRREIGIKMALGVRPRLLAVRQLLFAAQVALIGVLFGDGVGYLVGIPLPGCFRTCCRCRYGAPHSRAARSPRPP
jgi:putative ABC transport system permease protein